MNDKYSPAKCAHYGRRLATRLCDQHFASQPDAYLNGPALRSFTPVRQINLFVIKQLLNDWQSASRSYRSPYFNFESPEVQSALTDFMNLVSRHIQVFRSGFEPLLARAIAQTLQLVATPVLAFEELFLPPVAGNSPDTAALRAEFRFLDLDKAFYEGFLDALPTSGLTHPEVLERLTLYRTANYQLPQPLQRLVSELSALLPLTTADLLEDGPIAVAAAVAPAPVPNHSISAETAVAPPPTPANTAPATPASPLPALPPPALDATQPLPLHEKLKANQVHTPALAETLRATSATPNPTDHTTSKIKTLREAISINQRFSFINELFNGENMEYHAAIQHLDSLPTATQANTYITGHLSQQYDWSRKEEHVTKLVKLVERKFA